MPIDIYNKKIYEQDFPEEFNWNWKIAFIKEHKQKRAGVLLHDGKFMTNGVLFDKHEFKIKGPYPPKPKLFHVPEPIKKFFWKVFCYTYVAPKLWIEMFVFHKWDKKE